MYIHVRTCRSLLMQYIYPIYNAYDAYDDFYSQTDYLNLKRGYIYNRLRTDIH